jgi:hypothetical protein
MLAAILAARGALPQLAGASLYCGLRSTRARDARWNFAGVASVHAKGGFLAMHFTSRILLIVLLMGSGPTLSIAQVDRGRISSTAADAAKGVQRASTVLQLDYDTNRGGQRAIDTQTLNAMLTSTTLVDPAAKRALGLGPEMWPRVAQIELLPAGQAAVKLSVIITSVTEVKLPDNAAQLLLDELTSRAKAAVDQAALRQEQASNERRAAIEKELAVANEKYAKIQSQLRDLRAIAAAGVGDSGGGRGVAQEMQQIEVNLAAQRARLKIIEEEIAKLANKPADAKAKPDPESFWAELVAAREKAVRAAEASRATSDSPENQLAVAKAEAELAEAKIRAATSSEGIRPGFDSPDRWQGERITLRATIAEQEGRLGALSERLAQQQKKSDATSQQLTPYDIDRLQRDEQRARQEVDELNQQLDQLRRERRGMGMAPKLLILDGRAEAEPATKE